MEFVRLMMQRLQCNVFMLSYRGYDITLHFCTIFQTCSSVICGYKRSHFICYHLIKLNMIVGMVRVMAILLRKGSHMMHRFAGSFMCYFTGSINSQFLQIFYVLGCTWSSSSEEGHWYIQDSYLWKIFRRRCGCSSCEKQSWEGSHFTQHHYM